MKNLDQIRQESKEIKDKIDDTEERLRQLKNQEKKILKQDIVKRRKERTHRLITRGAILESLIENAEELTDEEIKILLEDQQRQKNSKKHYNAEDLVGKTLLVIVNLPTRKMMGIDSEGMIISAIHEEEGEEKLNLVILSNRISAGGKTVLKNKNMLIDKHQP